MLLSFFRLDWVKLETETDRCSALLVSILDHFVVSNISSEKSASGWYSAIWLLPSVGSNSLDLPYICHGDAWPLSRTPTKSLMDFCIWAIASRTEDAKQSLGNAIRIASNPTTAIILPFAGTVTAKPFLSTEGTVLGTDRFLRTFTSVLLKTSISSSTLTLISSIDFDYENISELSSSL